MLYKSMPTFNVNDAQRLILKIPPNNMSNNLVNGSIDEKIRTNHMISVPRLQQMTASAFVVV